MRKHDEGYILAYVFVTLVVICLIAVSVLTIPLNNVRVQRVKLQQMQEQYKAQERLEQILALLDDAGDNTAAAGQLSTTTLFADADNLKVEYKVWKVAGTSCEVSFTATEGSTRISMKLEITTDANITSGETGGSLSISGNLLNPQYEYQSYTVEILDAAAQGGGGSGEN